MAEDTLIEQPQVQQTVQTPPDGGTQPPYTQKVYAALKDNLNGFNKSPDEFNKAMQDPAYAARAYQALKDNLNGFTKTQDEFYDAVGLKKARGAGSPQSSTSALSPNVSSQSIGYTGNQQPLIAPDQQQTPDQQIQASFQKNYAQLSPEQKATYDSMRQVPTDQGEIKQYVEPTMLQKTAYAGKSFLTAVGSGIHAIKRGLQQLQDDEATGFSALGSKIRGDTPEQIAANQQAVKNTLAINQSGLNPAIEKVTPKGLTNPFSMDESVVGNDPDHPILNAVNNLAKASVGLAGASSTGGATFALQGMGSMADNIDQMKKNGVEFNNGSDKLMIYGAGLINLALAKGDLGRVFNSFGKSTQDNIVSNLTSDAISSMPKSITADEIPNYLTQKVNDLAKQVGSKGLSALNTYAKVGSEMSLANAATFGTKVLANKVSGNQPFQDTTGGDLVNTMAEPFGFNEATDGNPLMLLKNMATSTAGGFGLLEGLGSKSSVNPIVDRLSNDNSPEALQQVKNEISQVGILHGWSQSDIDEANKNADNLSATIAKLPKGLPPNKTEKGVSLINNRNALDEQLKSMQEQRMQLDPAVANVTNPQEELIQNKIDQANDKLRSLVTGNRATYSKGTEADNEEGKFFKTVNGVKEEIPESRYNLEILERDANKTQPPTENVVPETPQEVPATQVNEEPQTNIGKPTEQQIIDDLKNKRFATFKYDKESDIPDAFKDKEPTVNELTDKNGKVTKQFVITVPQSEADYLLSKGEQNDASKIESAGTLDVGEPSGNGEVVGEGNTGQVEPTQQGEPTDSGSENAPTENKITANEVIGKPITYHGEDAVLEQDGQTLVAKIKGSNREYELGNVDDIGDKSIKDLGIEHQNSVVSTNENGNITVRDKEYVNNYSDPLSAINRDKEGNVVSVNLETPDGEKRAFRGDVAEDIAYQLHLKEINKDNDTAGKFEQFAEEHEPTKQAIVAAEDANTAEKATVADNAEVQRKPARKVKEKAPIVDEPTTERGSTGNTPTGSDGERGNGNEPIKISDKAKALADRIRSLKSDKGVLHGGLEGIAAATWDGALETVATAIEKGGELADAINEGVKHILNAHPELKEDEVRKELDDKINGTEEPTEEGGTEVKKTILTKRAYEGDIQPEVKKYLEDKGLTRTSFSQEERSKQATDFINKFGEDAAQLAVENGDIEGGMAASILAQLQIRNSRAMAELPEGSDERDALAKKQADLIALMEKKGYLGGEFNGQLAHEYQNAELDFANVKKQVEQLTGKPLTPGQEKKVKDLTDQNEQLKAKLQESEQKLIEETDKAFKAGVEEAKNETNAQRAKRAADKLREKAKLSRPGVFSSATPASLVWDGAIEVTAKAIETGGKLADAINDGLKHIKESDWYKSLPQNKKDLAEKEFKRFNQGNVGSTDLADLQERFLDKTDNKFSTDEARDIWGYMKKTYLENGTSYKDALAKTASDLGLSWRQISEAITTPKLKRVSDEMWKKQADLARNRAGIKNWIGDQNKTLAGKALQKISGLFRGTAVFGHGGIFVGTHAGMTLFNPSMWSKTIPAFIRGWKFAYGNEGNYERSIEELKNSPNYLIAQRAGLKNNPERINAEEYQKSQRYLGKLGLAGEKGFNAIKVLRQDLFDYHFDRLGADERDDPAVAKSIAHLVNLATGATNVKIPAWVNEASFAGGMEASRWEKLIASPAKATEVALKALLTPDKATTPEKVFAKIWARRVGEQVGTFSALLLANAAIQNSLNPKNPVNYTNPDKSDFLKFKFGDVTIDPTSGMRSTAMFAYKLGKIPFEAQKELHGDKRIAVAAKDVGNYARGKLAPLYGTAVDFAGSQDYSGNIMPYSHDKPPKYAHKLTWGEYGTEKLPLPIAEAFNVYFKAAHDAGGNNKATDNVLKGIMSGAISGTTGFRVGEYGEKDEKKEKKK